MHTPEIGVLIEEFLTGTRPAPVINRILATVLFTDIVASTQRLTALGDQEWRVRLDRHDAMVRTQLGRFRGREINTAGDWFFATSMARRRCAVRTGNHRRRYVSSASKSAPGSTLANAKCAGMTSAGLPCTSAHASRRSQVQARSSCRQRLRISLPGVASRSRTRPSRAQGRPRRMDDPRREPMNAVPSHPPLCRARTAAMRSPVSVDDPASSRVSGLAGRLASIAAAHRSVFRTPAQRTPKPRLV